MTYRQGAATARWKGSWAGPSMGTALPRLAPACGGWAWRGKWGPSVAPAISQIQAPSRVSREVKNGAGADTRLEKRLKNRSRSIQLVGWWQLRPLTALWVLTLTLKVVAVILDKRNSVSFQLYSCFLLGFFPQKIMLTFSRNITFFLYHQTVTTLLSRLAVI